jgi:cell division protein FtsB
LTTTINGKEEKVILLENQLASLNRNNELLEENNTKLSEQNDKMLN